MVTRSDAMTIVSILMLSNMHTKTRNKNFSITSQSFTERAYTQRCTRFNSFVLQRASWNYTSFIMHLSRLNYAMNVVNNFIDLAEILITYYEGTNYTFYEITAKL